MCRLQQNQRNKNSDATPDVAAPGCMSGTDIGKHKTDASATSAVAAAATTTAATAATTAVAAAAVASLPRWKGRESWLTTGTTHNGGAHNTRCPHQKVAMALTVGRHRWAWVRICCGIEVGGLASPRQEPTPQMEKT